MNKKLFSDVKSDAVKNNETGAVKDVATQDDKFTCTVLNRDMFEVVEHAKATGKDPSVCINDVIEIFHRIMEPIEVPEFTFDEKIVIANSLCSAMICEHFIRSLDANVCDYIKYYCAGKTGLTESQINFVNRIKDLDFMQRVKLVYLIRSEFFSD